MPDPGSPWERENPNDGLGYISQRPAKDEAVTEAMIEHCRTAYRQGYNDGAEDALEQGVTPHKDTKDEGCADYLAAMRNAAPVSQGRDRAVEALRQIGNMLTVEQMRSGKSIFEVQADAVIAALSTGCAVEEEPR